MTSLGRGNDSQVMTTLFETTCQFGDVALVQMELPRAVRRWRAITADDGTPAGYVLCPFQLLCSEVIGLRSLPLDPIETALARL